jgi:hypothetical protein
MKKRLIISSAALFEVLPLLRVLDDSNVAYTYIEVGVGSINAAIISKSFNRIICERDIYFIGTCGSSQSRFVGSLVEAQSVCWSPGDVAKGDAYLVPNMEPTVDFSKSQGHSFSDVERVAIDCSPSISKRTFEDSGRFENIELYSVACNWASRANSMISILGVTNTISPNSHDEWRTTHKSMAMKTALFFQQEILPSVRQTL